jgi:sugar fermentation stimulation protein A
MNTSTHSIGLPQIQGTLIRRYKRFLADVLLHDGSVVTAHCPNSGKLLGMPADVPVLLSDHGIGGTRKLRYTFEAFLDGTTWVGVNTHDANRLVEKFIAAGALPEFAAYPTYKREVVYGERSRVDFLLTAGDQRLYLEVKSVHMKRGTVACFPDCPTERGAKHMQQLAKILDANTKAAVLYLVQRDDCEAFGYAVDLDPVYAAEAKKAADQGVDVFCYAVSIQPASEAVLVGRLPIEN